MNKLHEHKENEEYNFTSCFDYLADGIGGWCR